jgi:NAD(P)-dependent dehydrogenase (short-subunit alcohol dehydrogenase family)
VERNKLQSFVDRVVVITGAASGIGRRLAQLMAAEGARIGAVDVQAPGLTTLADEFKATGQAVALAVADATDAAAIRAAVADLETRLGPTDILIASAGIARENSASAYRAEDFAAQVQVNLIGVSNSIAAVLGGMLQRRSGHLVALSSLASYRGLPRMAGYCASKAGLNALMDSLRVELKPHGIACTTICPGFVRTPMTAPLDLPSRIMMDLDSAAALMVRAIRARRPFLAFPRSGAWTGAILRWLPVPLADRWVGARFLQALNRN